MNVSIIYLNYQRKDYDQQVRHNLVNNAGIPHDFIEIERKGVAAAINEGLKIAFETGAYYAAICANDITMPQNWLLYMVETAKRLPNHGISAIHCVEALPEMQDINGVLVRPSWGVFGNSLISRKAWETVGYFNTDHDPYGMQDSDYCYRLHKAGFLNYYLIDLYAEHIGHDVGNGTEYRKMKDEGLQSAGAKYQKWLKVYDSGAVYLPYDQEQYIINSQQYA